MALAWRGDCACQSKRSHPCVRSSIERRPCDKAAPSRFVKPAGASCNSVITLEHDSARNIGIVRANSYYDRVSIGHRQSIGRSPSAVLQIDELVGCDCAGPSHVGGVALSGNEDAEVKRGHELGREFGSEACVKRHLVGGYAGIGAEINTAAKQACSRGIISPAVALK